MYFTIKKLKPRNQDFTLVHCSSTVPRTGSSGLWRPVGALMKLRLCEHTVLLVLSSPMQDPQAGVALGPQNSLNPSLHVPFVSGSLGVWGDLVSPRWPRTPSPPALELSVLLSVWLLGAFVSASTGAAGTLVTSATLQALFLQNPLKTSSYNLLGEFLHWQCCPKTPLPPSPRIWDLRGSPGSLGQSVCLPGGPRPRWQLEYLSSSNQGSEDCRWGQRVLA